MCGSNEQRWHIYREYFLQMITYAKWHYNNEVEELICTIGQLAIKSLGNYFNQGTFFKNGQLYNRNDNFLQMGNLHKQQNFVSCTVMKGQVNTFMALGQVYCVRQSCNSQTHCHIFSDLQLV